MQFLECPPYESKFGDNQIVSQAWKNIWLHEVHPVAHL